MISLIQHPTLLDILYCAASAPQDEREQYEAFTGQPFKADHLAASYYSATGPKWGIYADSQALAVGGFFQTSPGTLRDWFISTPVLWEKHWFAATRAIRRLMDAVLASDDITALECYTLASRTAAHRWYKPLGYVHEATLQRRASGQDVFVFSRIR